MGTNPGPNLQLTEILLICGGQIPIGHGSFYLFSIQESAGGRGTGTDTGENQKSDTQQE